MILHDTVSYLLLVDAMFFAFLGNLLAAYLQSQFVCVSADVTCEVQGGDQASQDSDLEESSSGLDASSVSDVDSEEESSADSSDSNPTDAEFHELHDEDVHPQELALRHEMLQSFAAAIGRRNFQSYV